MVTAPERSILSMRPYCFMRQLTFGGRTIPAPSYSGKHCEQDLGSDDLPRQILLPARRWSHLRLHGHMLLHKQARLSYISTFDTDESGRSYRIPRPAPMMATSGCFCAAIEPISSPILSFSHQESEVITSRNTWHKELSLLHVQQAVVA